MAKYKAENRIEDLQQQLNSTREANKILIKQLADQQAQLDSVRKEARNVREANDETTRYIKQLESKVLAAGKELPHLPPWWC